MFVCMVKTKDGTVRCIKRRGFKAILRRLGEIEGVCRVDCRK